MCAGFPRLRVLRRLRPVSDRSVDDGPSPTPVLDTRIRATAETVPTFTVIRSTEEEPDSVPAASPQLPRSTSPWSPGQPLNASPEVPRPQAGAHRSRPVSARFEPVRALRDVNAGSSRTPFRHARRARVIWQYWTRPGFVRAACHPHRRHPDRAALSFTALLRQGRRRRSLTSTQINSASRRTQRLLKEITRSVPRAGRAR
jgi:hypothetical protein